MSKPLTPIERMIDAATGYNPNVPRRITLRCPVCGATMTVARQPHDPAEATVAVVPCPDCSGGCKVECVELYEDKDGRAVEAQEEE